MLRRHASVADGYPTGTLTRTEVASLLRGPASAPVVLTISRPGMSHSRGVYLERRPMTQPPLREVRTHVMLTSLSSALRLMSPEGAEHARDLSAAEDELKHRAF